MRRAHVGEGAGGVRLAPVEIVDRELQHLIRHGEEVGTTSSFA
jgi:hypothetical protein